MKQFVLYNNVQNFLDKLHSKNNKLASEMYSFVYFLISYLIFMISNFSITNDGAILFKWANNVTGNKYSSIQSDNDIISENTWYDIVVVYQNSGAVIYVNGQSVTTNLEWVAQGGNVLSTSQTTKHLARGLLQVFTFPCSNFVLYLYI